MTASAHRLPEVALEARPDGDPQGGGTAEDGVEVTAYGRGECAGTTYTVPAHSSASIDIDLNLMCVTPADVVDLDGMVRSMLTASHQSEYDETSKTSVSGGFGFFDVLCGGVEASTEDTKTSMSKWGLSEANQQKIVAAMAQLMETTNSIKETVTVSNDQYDYSVSGSVFIVVMDCTITQGSQSKQVRLLGTEQPTFIGKDQSGDITSLPTTKM